MTSDELVQLLQKGFHVTLGATASLVEAIQDPEKRDENLSKLNQEWDQLSQEWARKGEMTEQEAREFVDNLLIRRDGQAATTATSTAPDPGTSADSQETPPSLQLEIQELTAQLAAMRAELERLRQEESSAELPPESPESPEPSEPQEP